MKRGFTLIELMVASCLLGMLFIMMTMIFNQSSIAWRIGVASVTKLSEVRRTIGEFHERTDLKIPGLEARFESSLWNDKEELNSRAIVGGGSNDGTKYKGYEYGENSKSGGAGKSDSFVIGVRSAGPDGVFENEDDITTWPEDVN